MLYIEQIPRKDGEPFYTTDLEDIKAIQDWCALNCDTTKRHVITKTRLGRVIAEGLQIPAYYSYDYYTMKPIFKVLDCVRATCGAYKVFKTNDEAILWYLESKKEAMTILDSHESEVAAALTVFKEKGINFESWSDCSDDEGLKCGLGVSCTVNGFYFHKKILSIS